jgi:hypothetical protein
MLPKVGSKIIVRMLNTSPMLLGPFADSCEKYDHIEGIVVTTPHWEKDRDVFSLAVPGSEVPRRMINIRRVIAINGVILKHAPPAPGKNLRSKEALETTTRLFMKVKHGNVPVKVFTSGNDRPC